MHVDPDLLALHALGEDVLDGPDLEHLTDCARCRSDAAQLRQAVSYARVGGDGSADRSGDRTLSSTGPSPRVWDAIAAELDLADDLAAARPPTRTHGARRVRQPGRWRAVVPVALAASVAAVAAAGATAAWLSRESGSEPPPEPQLAARLAPLTADAGDGQAQVLIDGPDNRTLALTVDQLPATPGYHEVWLIDLDTGRMVSLGAVPATVAGPTSYPLPPGLDLAEYDVVDISDETLDGDPLHSGVSLLRGTLA